MKTDIVSLSLRPHRAPFPEERDRRAARQWAQKTMSIIQQDPGVEKLRAQRSTFDVIALDWPEGLEELGTLLARDDPHWWNPREINKNPLVQAAVQNSQKIVAAMVDPERIGKYVKISTLAGMIVGVSDIRHFGPEVFQSLMKGITHRREQLIEYDRRHMKNAVVSHLLKKGNSQLVAEIYGIENMPEIERAWMAKAIGIIESKTGVKHAPETGSWEESAIDLISRHHDKLIGARDWQEQGNTIFQVYMDQAPHLLGKFMDKYRAMLDAPLARQVLPRMKAWDMRTRLIAGIDPIAQPAKPRPGM